MKELLTVRQVAEILQLHEATIRRYISAGKLEAVRIGRNVRVPRVALEKFMFSQLDQAEPAAEETGAFREPAVAYQTAPSVPATGVHPAALTQLTDDLAALDESDLNQVFMFVADLTARREEQERKALARQIVAKATLLAKQDTRSREEVWDDLEAVIEEIRQQAIEKGTAIEGEYYGD